MGGVGQVWLLALHPGGGVESLSATRLRIWVTPAGMGSATRTTMLMVAVPPFAAMGPGWVIVHRRAPVEPTGQSLLPPETETSVVLAGSTSKG